MLENNRILYPSPEGKYLNLKLYQVRVTKTFPDTHRWSTFLLSDPYWKKCSSWHFSNKENELKCKKKSWPKKSTKTVGEPKSILA